MFKAPRAGDAPHATAAVWRNSVQLFLTLRCALGEGAISRVSRRPGRKLEVKRQVVAIETAPQPTP